MTTEQTTPQETKPVEAPKAPEVNVDVIVQKATEEATKAAEKIANKKAMEIANERLSKAASVLKGEPERSADDQVLEVFTKDPLKTLHTLKEITKKELRDELAADTERKQVEFNTVNPFIKEYPELNSPKKLALVERLADEYVSKGQSREQALKTACQETISEFGLKSVSEQERQEGYSAGLPSGGGFRQPATKFSEEKSQQDFLSGMRNRMQGYRTKK